MHGETGKENEAFPSFVTVWLRWCSALDTWCSMALVFYAFYLLQSRLSAVLRVLIMYHSGKPPLVGNGKDTEDHNSIHKAQRNLLLDFVDCILFILIVHGILSSTYYTLYSCTQFLSYRFKILNEFCKTLLRERRKVENRHNTVRYSIVPGQVFVHLQDIVRRCPTSNHS